MATNLHRVYQNIRWRIESLTPTSTRCLEKFRHRGDLAANESLGQTREFTIKRDGREGFAGVTNMYSRTAKHAYVVDVVYPTSLKRDALDEVISQDAHDIITALRDPAKYLGFNASNTATNIGIRDRLENSDQVLEDADLWTLRIKFDVTVKEVEQNA
jgi:hypothetical protein